MLSCVLDPDGPQIHGIIYLLLSGNISNEEEELSQALISWPTISKKKSLVFMKNKCLETYKRIFFLNTWHNGTKITNQFWTRTRCLLIWTKEVKEKGLSNHIQLLHKWIHIRSITLSKNYSWSYIAEMINWIIYSVIASKFVNIVNGQYSISSSKRWLKYSGKWRTLCQNSI